MAMLLTMAAVMMTMMMNRRNMNYNDDDTTIVSVTPFASGVSVQLASCEVECVVLVLAAELISRIGTMSL